MMNEPKNYPTIGILSFAHTINDMYGNYIPALLPFLVISFGSFPLLVFIAGLAGLGTAAFHPQASTMISNIGGRKKAILLSFFVAFGNIGFALSLLIFPPFFHKFGLGSTPFTVIPGLIVAILLFFFAPKAEYLKGTATNLKEVFGTLRTSSKRTYINYFYYCYPCSYLLRPVNYFSALFFYKISFNIME